VRAAVDDALRVVRVAGRSAAGLRVGEAAGERGVLRVADVDHVEPAAAGLAAGAGADGVGVAGLVVDHDVVGAVDARVVRVRLERDGRLAHAAQAAQVEVLHAVGPGAVSHDEGVVLVDLDVAPGRAG